MKIFFLFYRTLGINNKLFAVFAETEAQAKEFLKQQTNGAVTSVELVHQMDVPTDKMKIVEFDLFASGGLFRHSSASIILSR